VELIICGVYSEVHSGISLEEFSKNIMGKHSQNVRSHVRDFKPGLPKYGTGVLATQQRRLVYR
jgi:hypothetical protein